MPAPRRSARSVLFALVLAVGVLCPAALAEEAALEGGAPAAEVGAANTDGAAGEGFGDAPDSEDAGEDGAETPEEPSGESVTGDGTADITDGEANEPDAGEVDEAQADTVQWDASALAAPADVTSYAHTETATIGSFTLHVSYNDPVAGQPLQFHVQATGDGVATYKYFMGSVSYMDTDNTYEGMVNDDRDAKYTDYLASADYEFTPMATGAYWFEFYAQNINAGLTYLRCKFSVAINDTNYPSVAQRVTAAVAECDEKADGTEYGRALWLHDWLLDQLEYDYSYYWCSPESGLCRGKGTCESYQQIYAKLLTAAGIANGRVTGNGHTWNAVCIDGKWCQVDPTWDDSANDSSSFDARHFYFGLTDELMAGAHSDHTANYQADGYLYRSTDISNDYFVRHGDADLWADAYVERIQQHIDAQEPGFSITCDTSSSYNVVEGITAAVLSQREWTTGAGKRAGLSVEMGASGFTCTANYYYEVSDYKGPREQAAWTSPSSDGFAFAGWYADTAFTQVYTATSGLAYARFVPLSDLVRFSGCSLRDDGAGPDRATLRFCYEFAVPSGARLEGASWDCVNAKTGGTASVPVARYWLAGGDGMVANLAFTGIERDGARSSFSSAYSARGSVSYVTADGTAVTAAEARASSSSVLEAAAAAASGGAASEAEAGYARAILGQN